MDSTDGSRARRSAARPGAAHSSPSRSNRMGVGAGTTGARRALQWYLFDITSTIEVVAVATLDEDAGSAWPMPLPAGLESGTTFTMQLSGRDPLGDSRRADTSRTVQPTTRGACGPLTAIKGPPDLCTWQTGTGSPFEDREDCRSPERRPSELPETGATQVPGRIALVIGLAREMYPIYVPPSDTSDSHWLVSYSSETE